MRGALLGLSLLLLGAVIAPRKGLATVAADVDAACNATPITHRIPDRSLTNLSHNWAHIGKLWMGYTLADHSFKADPEGQKIAWWREKGSAYGKLRVTGRKLDGDASPLTASIPSGYAITWGFQASGLYFPAAGCWQVVARVGLTQRYVFVVSVM
jgi:hypothetical protein